MNRRISSLILFIFVSVLISMTPNASSYESEQIETITADIQQTRQEAEIGKGVTAQPEVLGERVLVLSSDGWAVLVSCSSGKILWRERAGYGFDTSPATIGNFGYVASQGNKRYLASIALPSGKTMWKTDCGDLRAGPVAVDNGLVILESDGTLQCFDNSNPTLRWSTPIGKPCLDRLFVSGDRLLACCADTVLSVDAFDGIVEWGYHFEYAETFHPAGSGDEILLVRRGGEVVLLSLDTEDILWSTTVEPSPNYHLAISDSMAFITAGSRLNCLNTENGRTLWQVKLPSPASGPPLVSGNLLAVTTVHGGLYLYETGSGGPLGELELGQPVSSSPVMCSGRIYVATQLGKLISFSFEDFSSGGEQ
jgi:outer membrane protein assembly factor BamB